MRASGSGRALLAAALCVAAACGKKASLGGHCGADDGCGTGLACHRGECLQAESVKHMRAAEAKAGAEGAPARSAGDQVEVEWRGAYKPAIIVGMVARGSYRVRFEGQDASWDEVVTDARIRGGAKGAREEK